MKKAPLNHCILNICIINLLGEMSSSLCYLISAVVNKGLISNFKGIRICSLAQKSTEKCRISSIQNMEYQCHWQRRIAHFLCGWFCKMGIPAATNKENLSHFIQKFKQYKQTYYSTLCHVSPINTGVHKIYIDIHGCRCQQNTAKSINKSADGFQTDTSTKWIIITIIIKTERKKMKEENKRKRNENIKIRNCGKTTKFYLFFCTNCSNCAFCWCLRNL